MEIQIEHVVAIVVAIFACDGFWSYIRYKAESRKGHNKEIQVIKEGLLALLHDRLYNIGEMYIMSGYITFDEFDNLAYLYKPYKDLGGNSTGDDVYEKCKNLPRKQDSQRAVNM